MGIARAIAIRWGMGAVLSLACAATALAQAPAKPATTATNAGQELVAVMDLEPINSTKVQAIAISDRLREELLKTHKFVLVNRDQMDAVLNEQALQQTGCTSSECAVKVGQVLGVRKLVTGRVLKLDDTHWQLSATIIDVETAQTLSSESIQYEGDFFALLQTGIVGLSAKLSGQPTPAVASAPVAAVIGTLPPAGPGVSPASLVGVYDCAGTNPNGGRYRGEVHILPLPENQLTFTWAIGSQSFKGVGTISGRTVTVDWGDPSPVIYQVKQDGTLDGTWANGTGTEVLTRR
jgi:TolB-like protein